MDDFDEAREDGDIDNFDIAGKILKPVERYLADHMTGAYRGINGVAAGESEKVFYRDFLQSVEAYLNHIGFQKEELHVGEYISEYIKDHNDGEGVSIIRHRTNNPSLYGKIREVERQPYYIDVLDGDDLKHDKVQKMYLAGSCVVYVEQ